MDEIRDVPAVQVDDVVIDAIGSGRLSIDVAFELGDPLALLLAAWVADVREGLG